MSDRTFETRMILASIHAFPMILAAEKPETLMACFDKLRAIAPKIAGLDLSTDQIAWAFSLSPALRSVLKQEFNALAQEPLPDSTYWHTVEKTPEPAKLAVLALWLSGIEQKYGKTLEVPDISEKVRAQINALSV